MSSKYFELDQKQKKVFFTGDQLEIFIPDRYENFGALFVEEAIMSLAVFDMTINENIKTGFFLPAMIHIKPSVTEFVNVGANSMTKLTLYKGDQFMTTEVVRQSQLVYNIFSEFISLGRMPDFVKYQDTLFLFDIASELTGLKFEVDHVTFEVIMSYIHRDPDDLSVQYRLTDLSKDPRLIPLRQISVLAESTSSKLLGSFFDAATDSALVNKAEESTELEEIMRK